MKTTLERFEEFYNSAAEYMGQFPKERSPQTYALGKLLTGYQKKLAKLQARLERKRQDLQAEHCLKDPNKGNAFIEDETKLTMKDGSQQVVYRKRFSREGEKACNEAFQAEREAFYAQEYEYEPHFVERPHSRNISIHYAEAFTGFIFKPFETAEEEEAWFLGVDTHPLAGGENENGKHQPETAPA